MNVSYFLILKEFCQPREVSSQILNETKIEDARSKCLKEWTLPKLENCSLSKQKLNWKSSILINELTIQESEYSESLESFVNRSCRISLYLIWGSTKDWGMNTMNLIWWISWTKSQMLFAFCNACWKMMMNLENLKLRENNSYNLTRTKYGYSWISCTYLFKTNILNLSCENFWD